MGKGLISLVITGVVLTAATVYTIVDENKEGKKIKKCVCCNKDVMKKNLTSTEIINIKVKDILNDYGYGYDYFYEKYNIEYLYNKYNVGNENLICSECAIKNSKELRKEIDKINMKIENDIIKFENNYRNIYTYPVTYKGRIYHDMNVEIQIESQEYFKNKDEALNSLKIAAVEAGCDLVYDVEYTKSTGYDIDTNYTYSIWSTSGIATKSK